MTLTIEFRTIPYSKGEKDDCNALDVKIKGEPLSPNNSFQVTFGRSGSSLSIEGTLHNAMPASLAQVWKYRPAMIAEPQPGNELPDLPARASREEDHLKNDKTQQQEKEEADEILPSEKGADKTVSAEAASPAGASSSALLAAVPRRSSRDQTREETKDQDNVEVHEDAETSGTKEATTLVALGAQGKPVSLTETDRKDMLSNAQKWHQHLRPLLFAEHKKVKVRDQLLKTTNLKARGRDDLSCEKDLRAWVNFLEGEIDRLSAATP